MYQIHYGVINLVPHKKIKRLKDVLSANQKPQLFPLKGSTFHRNFLKKILKSF